MHASHLSVFTDLAQRGTPPGTRLAWRAPERISTPEFERWIGKNPRSLRLKSSAYDLDYLSSTLEPPLAARATSRLILVHAPINIPGTHPSPSSPHAATQTPSYALRSAVSLRPGAHSR